MANKTENLSPMQQELLSRADAIFMAIADATKNAVDFAKVEIPEIATQYIHFGMAYNTFIILVAILLAVFGAWSLVKGLKDEYNGEGKFIIGLVCLLVGWFTILGNIKEFLLVWFAPKIWLIQNIVHLVQGK